MKTEKLIPFDINIALKHPERVRHKDGRKCVSIAHFPTADLAVRVVVLFDAAGALSFYTEDGCVTSVSYPSLFLTAETKHIPWTTIDEVPEGVYFRNKGNGYYYIATGFSADRRYICLNETWISLVDLYAYYEYSPNRNGPWFPCGKEVEI